MDEATASIDYATDAKIQETIRELEGRTIVTIAHRLKTIVDYDRVIVMERGEVVEMGEPWSLLGPEGEDEKGVRNEAKSESEGEGLVDVTFDDSNEQTSAGATEGLEGKKTKSRPASVKSSRQKKKKKKRWFREMCEMSGEIEALEREARRSYEAKRLVDAG